MKMKQAEKIFRDYFKVAPEALSRAPGRLEILGNHTDYNEGFVLSCATGQHTSFAGAVNESGVCRIYDGKLKEMASFSPDDLANPQKGQWVNYLKGMVSELQKRGFSIGGLDAVLDSCVPLSAGMSSSAALEISFGFLLRELFPIEMKKEDWARTGQGVENNYMGVKTGLLDQFSSIFGKENSLILCDFRSVEVLETVPMSEEYAIVVGNTLVKHNLVESDYNLRRESCERVRDVIRAACPQVKALRDVDSSLLASFKNKLDAVDYKRALHIVGEDERVMKGIAYLKEGKVEDFGSLLFESHESSRNFFENSCPELDALVEIARSMPDACVGARLSGGGFGGISIHLVKKDAAELYAKRLEMAYNKMTGKECKTILTTIGNGAFSRKLG